MYFCSAVTRPVSHNFSFAKKARKAQKTRNTLCFNLHEFWPITLESRFVTVNEAKTIEFVEFSLTSSLSEQLAKLQQVVNRLKTSGFFSAANFFCFVVISLYFGLKFAHFLQKKTTKKIPLNENTLHFPLPSLAVNTVPIFFSFLFIYLFLFLFFLISQRRGPSRFTKK